MFFIKRNYENDFLKCAREWHQLILSLTAQYPHLLNGADFKKLIGISQVYFILCQLEAKTPFEKKLFEKSEKGTPALPIQNLRDLFQLFSSDLEQPQPRYYFH